MNVGQRAVINRVKQRYDHYFTEDGRRRYVVGHAVDDIQTLMGIILELDTELNETRLQLATVRLRQLKEELDG